MTDKTRNKPGKTDGETSAVTIDSDDLTHEITESSGSEFADLTEADIGVVEAAEAADEDEDAADLAESEDRPGINWSRVLAFAVLPVLALLLGAAAAFLKWQDASVRESDTARVESLQAAKDATIRLLSYKPDTVEQDLTSARDLMTGNFLESYTQLIRDVVIPGAKQTADHGARQCPRGGVRFGRSQPRGGVGVRQPDGDRGQRRADVDELQRQSRAGQGR